MIKPPWQPFEGYADKASLRQLISPVLSTIRGFQHPRVIGGMRGKSYGLSRWARRERLALPTDDRNSAAAAPAVDSSYVSRRIEKITYDEQTPFSRRPLRWTRNSSSMAGVMVLPGCQRERA